MKTATRLHNSGNRIRALAAALTRTDNEISPALLRLALAVVVFPDDAQNWIGGYGSTGTMGYFTRAMGMPWLRAQREILINFFGSPRLLTSAATDLAGLGIARLRLHPCLWCM